MLQLKRWPPDDDVLTINQSHSMISFGNPLTNEMRYLRMQQHGNQITSMEGWSFYFPCNDVEGEGSCRDYGTLFSSSDMCLFDRVVQQFRKVEHENEMSFTSITTLDKYNLRHWYYEAKVEWNISQNKHLQTKLVNRKRKVSTFHKEKWAIEKMVCKSKRDKKKAEYIQRLLAEGDFSKREERRKILRNSRRRKMRLRKIMEYKIQISCLTPFLYLSRCGDPLQSSIERNVSQGTCQ
jgi:hypothetical protein